MHTRNHFFQSGFEGKTKVVPHTNGNHKLIGGDKKLKYSDWSMVDFYGIEGGYKENYQSVRVFLTEDFEVLKNYPRSIGWLTAPT
jgi:hypothetical protein